MVRARRIRQLCTAVMAGLFAFGSFAGATTNVFAADATQGEATDKSTSKTDTDTSNNEEQKEVEMVYRGPALKMAPASSSEINWGDTFLDGESFTIPQLNTDWVASSESVFVINGDSYGYCANYDKSLPSNVEYKDLLDDIGSNWKNDLTDEEVEQIKWVLYFGAKYPSSYEYYAATQIALWDIIGARDGKPGLNSAEGTAAAEILAEHVIDSSDDTVMGKFNEIRDNVNAAMNNSVPAVANTRVPLKFDAASGRWSGSVVDPALEYFRFDGKHFLSHGIDFNVKPNGENRIDISTAHELTEDVTGILIKDADSVSGGLVWVADSTEQDVIGGTVDVEGAEYEFNVYTVKNDKPVTVKVAKTSKNPKVQGSCYGALSDAVYGVYDSAAKANQDRGRLATLHANTAESYTTNIAADSSKTFYVKEITAPRGYELDENIYSASVKAGDTYTFQMTDEPMNDPVAIAVSKTDNSKIPVSGAEYTIKYYDFDESTRTSSQLSDPAKAGKAAKYSFVFRTNKDGELRIRPEYLVSGDSLTVLDETQSGYNFPLGVVTIQETKAPAGYALNDAMYIISLRENGQNLANTGKSYRLTTANEAIGTTDARYFSGVVVHKKDSVTGTAQGDATLEGITFTVTADRDVVLKDGTRKTKGETIATLVTNKNGDAETGVDALPLSDGINNEGLVKYTITETKSNASYELPKAAEAAGSAVTLNTESFVAINRTDDVVKTNLVIVKQDAATGKSKAQEGYSFDGIEVTVKNASEQAISYDGKTIASGEAIGTYNLKDGKVALSNLPYGTYTVQETKTNQYYELNDEVQTVILHGSDQTVTIKDKPVRADFSLLKKTEEGEVLSGIPFLVRNKATGEQHILVTDQDGKFNSNAATHNNRNDAALDGHNLDEVLAGYEALKAEDLDTTAGVCFGTQTDEYGALVLGEYELTELRVQSGTTKDDVEAPGNQDRILITDSFRVSSDVDVSLGTYVNKRVAMKTYATDKASRTKQLSATGELPVVKDLVTYSGLVKGKEYTVVGVLKNENGESVLTESGEAVTGRTTFTATESDGEVIVELALDETARETVKGKKAVVFERLYSGSNVDDQEPIVKHENPDDDDQTVYEPDFYTEALDDASKTHIEVEDCPVKIIDTVTYSGLIAGKQYTLKAVVIDKATGEPFLADLKTPDSDYTESNRYGQITATTTFTASYSGTTTVELPWNAKKFAGHVLVVYQTLYDWTGRVVAIEHDPDKEDQTIYVPKVTTELVDSIRNDHYTDETCPVKQIDKIHFEGFKPGTYVIKGILYDKETGEIFIGDQGDGEHFGEITVEKTVVITGTTYDTTVEFTWNAKNFGNRTIVAYETVYDATGRIVAVEHDINKEDQTVSIIPEETPDEPAEEPEYPSSRVETGDTNANSRIFFIILIGAASVVLLATGLRKKRV